MSQSIAYLLVLLLITVVLDYYLVSRWAIYKRKLKEQGGGKAKRPQLFKRVFLDEPIQYWNTSRFGRFVKRINLLPYFELFVLALWAIYVGWEYLDMDPHKIPMGRELGSSIAANHLWTQIVNCGSCAMWNGFQRGGYPAFADIQGSMLHPVVIFATLGFGVVNGIKITLLISFWLAGVAQWWIARELNLSWLPRIWSAGIAIAGGHLAGRMDLGVYGVVLSTAATSLVFAALIRLAKNNTRGNALLLGILTAAAIVSGQGYIQVGLIGILPVFVFFYWGKENIKSTWSNYILATLIAFLLAAPFLVPFLHFSPNISKWLDPEFISAQPISYFILNLVIDDPYYFYSGIMTKFPYPYLYTLYIGWVPVLLFIYAINRISTEDKKLIWFMSAGIVMEFLIASAILLKLLVGIFPALAGVRHPPQIAGLAIPLILGVSAYGLEKLLSIKWLDLIASMAGRSPKWEPLVKWLIVIPLIYSLQSCLEFSTMWTGVTYLRNDLFLTLEKMKTTDLQWVNPPFGEHSYVEAAIAMGMKLSPGILTWEWKNRISPPPRMTAERRIPINNESKLIEDVSKIEIKFHRENLYASVVSGDKISACRAAGSGGYIEVTCNTDKAGILTVQENMWTGWYAWLDGEKIEIIKGDRLQVSAPAGKHTFTFRYLPWDVPLGLLLFTIGIFSVVWLYLQEYKQNIMANQITGETEAQTNDVDTA